MKYLILISLILSGCAPLLESNYILTDEEAGYDQAAYDELQDRAE